MSNEANNDKIGVFIQEANRMGIEILPPDVNKSMLKFTPEKMPSGKLAVRYGLAAIKNVGEGAMQILLEEREKNGEFPVWRTFVTGWIPNLSTKDSGIPDSCGSAGLDAGAALCSVRTCGPGPQRSFPGT